MAPDVEIAEWGSVLSSVRPSRHPKACSNYFARIVLGYRAHLGRIRDIMWHNEQMHGWQKLNILNTPHPVATCCPKVSNAGCWLESSPPHRQENPAYKQLRQVTSVVMM